MTVVVHSVIAGGTIVNVTGGSSGGGGSSVLVINDLITGGGSDALSAQMGVVLQNSKQATLISTTNIKTINGISVLGSGDIPITATASWGSISGTLASQSDLNIVLSSKQAALVSASNIKTINGTSILGSGDIPISGTAAWGSVTGTLSSQSDLSTALSGKQATLVSATNIKTINGTSILGSGDIATSGSSLTIQDEGTPLSTAATTINFVGAGVAATGSGATKTVTISGAGLTNTDSLTEGSTNLYYTDTRVRAAALTGIDVATTGAVVATDSVLAAIGKLQATKVDGLPSVDVSTFATLTSAAHSRRHLYSTTDANTTIALPSSGNGIGDYIEYTNYGAVPHGFTGGFASPGYTLIVNPKETIQFLYQGQWDSNTQANVSTTPTAGDKSANYTTVLTDAGKRIRHPSTDANARTFTIDGTLAYLDGTVMTFVNRTANVVSVALTGGSGTLRLGGSATTGTRSVAQHGYCTVMLDGGDWLAAGPGVT